MRTLHRNIVGAFIFSADGKVLLGHNKNGGVYQSQLVVPGGGIEENESNLEALIREVKEEIGLDISQAIIREIEGLSTGESEKTLKDTGERVLMQMNFYDYEVKLSGQSDEITLSFNDDYADAKWYYQSDLQNASIGQATFATLHKLQYI
jgi:8-oxo-dGTP pyrophosphatase MutT (NUDIX family)